MTPTCESCGQALPSSFLDFAEWIRQLPGRRYGVTQLWEKWERERFPMALTFTRAQDFAAECVKTGLVTRFRTGAGRFLIIKPTPANSRPSLKNPPSQAELEAMNERANRERSLKPYDPPPVPAAPLTDLGPLLDELGGTLPRTPQEV